MPALLLLLTAATPAASADTRDTPDYERALVAIFAFGDTGAWMGCGFVVADGGWALTTADLLTERFGPTARATLDHATVLSPWTGDAYRAEVKFVDRKANLALLKLPIKGLPAAPLAGADALQRVAVTTMGQLLTSGEMIGRRWKTGVYALGRQSPSKETARLAVKKWAASNACLVQYEGSNWLFLGGMDPDENAPRAALVWRVGAGAVAIYNRRLILDSFKRPVKYGQCLSSTDIARVLGRAGLTAESLTKVAEPTVQPDKVSEQATQGIWATLSHIILGRWADAVRTATALVELRPESSLANLLLGASIAGGGKPQEGLKSMDKAVCLDPSSADAYFTRGTALASLGKAKEAEADFKKAMELSPADINPRMALVGLLAADKDRIDEAIDVAKKAVQLAPERPGPRLTLARMLKSRRNYDQAIAELEALIKIAPDWAPAEAALAVTQEAAGNLIAAETAYREVVKLEPKNPDALFALASFLADHDRKDEAKKLVTQILELKPPKEIEAAAKELEKKLQPEPAP